VKRKRRVVCKVRLKATRTAAKAPQGPVVVRKVRRRKIVRKLPSNRARTKVLPVPLWPDPGTVF
jgi:hypothetical protein